MWGIDLGKCGKLTSGLKKLGSFETGTHCAPELGTKTVHFGYIVVWGDDEIDLLLNFVVVVVEFSRLVCFGVN
jgi:hypothetical protein